MHLLLLKIKHTDTKVPRKALSLCLLLALVFLFQSTASLAAVKIEGVRVWQSPEKTRLVFDINQPVEHNIFPLTNPNRIVVDLKSTATSSVLKNVDFKNSDIKSMRMGLQKNDVLRLVLDLKKALTPKSNLLKPNDLYGHRLVLDLYDQEKKQQLNAQIKKSENRNREVIIAIDAGHGGEDPGAIGPSGLQEKKVTLAIAKKLQAAINKEPGMRAVLTRTGDYFVKLKRRRDIARDKYHADLFVSIHADAWIDQGASGASVWVLSQGGATKALAVYLENAEKESETIGGVDLEDKDDVLKGVLVDIAMEGTLDHSFKASKAVLTELEGVAKLHKKHVEQAGFAVLKSPDMPSMLVELGFISNRKEEARLNNKRHQQKFAQAMLAGIKDYFKTQPPPGTYFASLREKQPVMHVVKSGETLSAIAVKYRVSTGDLKKENKLAGDRIQVGQALRVPKG